MNWTPPRCWWKCEFKSIVADTQRRWGRVWIAVAWTSSCRDESWWAWSWTHSLNLVSVYPSLGLLYLGCGPKSAASGQSVSTGSGDHPLQTLLLADFSTLSKPAVSSTCLLPRAGPQLVKPRTRYSRLRYFGSELHAPWQAPSRPGRTIWCQSLTCSMCRCCWSEITQRRPGPDRLLLPYALEAQTHSIDARVASVLACTVSKVCHPLR